MCRRNEILKFHSQQSFTQTISNFIIFSKKWKRYKIKGELSVDLTINLIVLNSKFKFKYLI